MGDPQNENADADHGKREQGADAHQFADETDRQKTREDRDDRAGEQRRDIGGAKLGMHDRREWRQQAVARHRIQDPRLAEQQHQNDRTQAKNCAELDDGGEPVKPDGIGAERSGRARSALSNGTMPVMTRLTST